MHTGINWGQRMVPETLELGVIGACEPPWGCRELQRFSERAPPLLGKSNTGEENNSEINQWTTYCKSNKTEQDGRKTNIKPNSWEMNVILQCQLSCPCTLTVVYCGENKPYKSIYAVTGHTEGVTSWSCAPVTLCMIIFLWAGSAISIIFWTT